MSIWLAIVISIIILVIEGVLSFYGHRMPRSKGSKVLTYCSFFLIFINVGFIGACSFWCLIIKPGRVQVATTIQQTAKALCIDSILFIVCLLIMGINIALSMIAYYLPQGEE